MAALTTSSDYAIVKKIWTHEQTFRIANAVRIWAGALTGLPGANALTSSRGYLVRWQDQVSLQWAGIAQAQSWTGGLIASAQSGTAANVQSVLGDTAATPIPEITVETGPLIIERAVTGVSAQADVWRTLVYCTTDNQDDMTTTATSYSPAIGKVLYWFSSTTCQVEIFGMLRATAIS